MDVQDVLITLLTCLNTLEFSREEVRFGTIFWEYDQNMLILCLLQAGKDRFQATGRNADIFPATDKQ